MLKVQLCAYRQDRRRQRHLRKGGTRRHQRQLGERRRQSFRDRAAAHGRSRSSDRLRLDLVLQRQIRWHYQPNADCG